MLDLGVRLTGGYLLAAASDWATHPS